MKSALTISAVCALLWLNTVPASAQRVEEFPPRLPPSFAGIPLDGGRVHSISVHPTNSNHVVI